MSFNLSDDPSICLEGEVYVSLDRAREQAEEYDVPFAEEVIRLVTHGLLQLCGRVHDTPDAFKSMTEETDRIMEHFKRN